MRNPTIQLSFTPAPITHAHASELERMSAILDANPRCQQLVAQDLRRDVRNPGTGRPGLNGDQVLRILLIKQMNRYSYEELAFHLEDSATYRRFCRLPAFDPTPARTSLAENLKKVRPRTLEKVNRRLMLQARALGIETGKKIRTDATVTDAPIHHPRDAALLYDSVRVVSRLLGRLAKDVKLPPWTDHTKRAKRRSLEILNTRSRTKRVRLYRNLLEVARKNARCAQAAVRAVQEQNNAPRRVRRLAHTLEAKLPLLWAIIDQTERRVLRGEKVPAGDKIVSLFEDHTDIIIKDRREVRYGHKVYLTGGASGLITDCVIADGNPADSALTIPLLRRHQRLFGSAPTQASFDGGFASKTNLAAAKAMGVTDVAFAKKRGLQVTDMVRSTTVYRRLRNFRAGIEGMISFLKRVFGLDRCTWRSRASFASYVLSSVIAANLLTLARHLLS